MVGVKTVTKLEKGVFNQMSQFIRVINQQVLIIIMLIASTAANCLCIISHCQQCVWKMKLNGSFLFQIQCDRNLFCAWLCSYHDNFSINGS